MRRLQQALARLDRAVARLEAICAGGAAGEDDAGRYSRKPEAESGWRHEPAADTGAKPEGTLIRFDRVSGEGGEE